MGGGVCPPTSSPLDQPLLTLLILKLDIYIKIVAIKLSLITDALNYYVQHASTYSYALDSSTSAIANEFSRSIGISRNLSNSIDVISGNRMCCNMRVKSAHLSSGRNFTHLHVQQ